ncbi:MAG: glutathione S-transferase family protein [Hyphomicrobiaceae bacterium]|nr:glutathione S-transferase family protein [Hyphomicrobiaceae bacterium]
MRKLYDFQLSGNCHKVRMMLAMLDLQYEVEAIDLLKGEQHAPEFLELNPMHKVPVLDDDGLILADSAAILIYLARKYGREDLYPDDPAAMTHIQKWLSFSVNEVFNGLALARAMVIFNRELDEKAVHAVADIALNTLESRLTIAEWLALDRPTLADIACYPYTARIEEGNISLEAFPATRAWIARVEGLPGFIPMPTAG